MRAILRSLALFSSVLGFLAGGSLGAKADVVWDVNATFDDGTVLTGAFSINVYGYLDGAYLTTQTKGPFTGFTYTASDSYVANNSIFIQLQPGYTSDLQIQFTNSLSVPSLNNSIAGGEGQNSYECQGSYSCYVPAGGVVRYIASGSADGTIGPAVPESSTWVMLVLGFAGLGFLSYRRKNQPAAAAA